MPNTLTIDLGPRSYPVVVGAGVEDGWTVPLARAVGGRRVGVITDGTVAALYGDAFQDSLKLAGAGPTSWYVVPPGESSKSASVLERLWDELLGDRFGRDGLIVALGGGVVGDLAGFAAATIHRGVDWVQVPTTLLAMVDSAIGGKTGINHARGKNLLGAFHQPVAVAVNLSVLETLPRLELSSGFAEVIKYGVIRDAPLFETLEREAPHLLALRSGQLLEIILASARIKSDVVAQDERESGLRMILNYGHTLGHAIERTAGFGAWTHGQAVAAGMVLAAELGTFLGLTAPGLTERVEACCRVFELPIRVDTAHRAALSEAVVHDKKVRGDAVQFVIPLELGRVAIHPVPLADLERWLAGA